MLHKRRKHSDETKRKISKANSGENHGMYKHGLHLTKIYGVWCRMKRRCDDPRRENYNCYGGRGIKVCDEWKNNAKTFCDWAYANGYRENLSIERIDVNGDYTPINCTFIPISKQARNRRNTIRIKYNGYLISTCDIEDSLGMKRKTITDRMRRGWAGDKLFRPASIKRKVLQIDESGNIVALHESIKSAAECVNGKSTGIFRCCKGTYHRHTHRGFIWKYVNQGE